MQESTGAEVNPFRQLAAYLAAGRAIAGSASDVGVGDAKAILEKLEYLPLDEKRPDQSRHRVALLEAAGRFTRVFQLESPDAPGVARAIENPPPCPLMCPCLPWFDDGFYFPP